MQWHRRGRISNLRPCPYAPAVLARHLAGATCASRITSALLGAAGRERLEVQTVWLVVRRQPNKQRPAKIITAHSAADVTNETNRPVASGTSAIVGRRRCAV